MGLHNYHSTHRCFPAGQYIHIDDVTPDDWVRWSWFQAALPYIEEPALADIYAKHLRSPRTGPYSYTNLPEKKKVVSGLMCPTDPANPKTTNTSGTDNQQGFHGNYVLNAGNTFFNTGGVQQSTKLNGVFFVASNTSIAEIRDGTTSTLLASELILVPDDASGEDVRGRYHNVRHAGALFSTLYSPNASEPDRFNYCIGTTVREAPCSPTGTDVVVSARSYHTGGAMAAMADGSVHFLAADIDLTVYHALGSRAGGEVIGSF